MLLSSITNNRENFTEKQAFSHSCYPVLDFKQEFLGIPSDFNPDGVIPFKYYLSKNHKIENLSLMKIHAQVLKRQAECQQNIDAIKLVPIIELTLDSNELDHFPKIFQNHPTITSLRLANNDIKKLENLPSNLRSLEISGNQCTEFSLLEIHQLLKLKHLALEACGFLTIPDPQIFTQLSYLTSLILLTEIPSELAFCRKLGSLSLSENQISKIPENALSVFPLLEDLNLSGNELTNFKCPESVKNLLIHSNCLENFEITDTLEQLQISDNKLRTLDCSKKQNLIWIDFSMNKLKKMPKNVHQTSLKYLHARDNQIKNLPRSISRLRNSLQVLDLSDNFLETDLHENLAALENLQILKFSGNPVFRLKKVHSRFLMSKVSELILDRTDVGVQGLVDVLSFSGENLKILSVKNCELEELPNSPVWGNAYGLKNVIFEGNYLKNVPEIVFQALTNLEILALNGNSLEGKNPIIGIKHCSKIVKINLSENKINRLETILLELRGLKSLVILDFEENPIEGVFLGRDIGLLVELQRQVFQCWCGIVRMWIFLTTRIVLFYLYYKLYYSP